MVCEGVRRSIIHGAGRLEGGGAQWMERRQMSLCGDMEYDGGYRNGEEELLGET